MHARQKDERCRGDGCVLVLPNEARIASIG